MRSRINKILLVEPPKSRQYYTRYPPLALLKLAALHRQKGDMVYLARGLAECDFTPSKIYITSLFTYAYDAVHSAISYYSQKYSKTEIMVGGIYATLCDEHLTEAFGDRIIVHKGLFPQAENILPDYSLVPDFKSSIIFASRGCVNRCHFCSVPKLEPEFCALPSVSHLIYPGHTSVVFWDNNFLASRYRHDILSELEERRLRIDFNQGLDARLLTADIVERLSRLDIPILRLAYDSLDVRSALESAVALLKTHGIRGRRIVVYCLFNTEDKNDNPETFFARIKDLMNWGVVAYPMRYQSLTPSRKDNYVSPHWNSSQLNMVAKARRVLGYGGAFPPYTGLKQKFIEADTFELGFKLRPPLK